MRFCSWGKFTAADDDDFEALMFFAVLGRFRVQNVCQTVTVLGILAFVNGVFSRGYALYFSFA